ncbi:hypothetical protein [Nonomuraea endophytica]|uniref:Uncharacterized protein n=1 Tax=Nonomuraea endophytica TaxID=714136 RepID=A0A7W8AF15_9ACTN|nr:hypothetical protein [Nonomuraea endophytica]MBB5084982.1 hypothetical protein [Nonomuraea endophytica]
MTELVPYGGPYRKEEPQPDPPQDQNDPPPRKDPEPSAEEEQRQADTERGRRADGLRYLFGPAWYAGPGGAGRDRTTSWAARDVHSYHADTVNMHTVYQVAQDFVTPPRFGGLTRDDLDLRHRLHVGTGSDEWLRASVARHRAVVLCGEASTGRRDSALRVLSAIVPVSRAHEFPVEIAEVGTIEALFPEPPGDPAPGRMPGWRVEPERAYVLDASGLSGRVNRAHLDALKRAAGTRSWVIVLAAESALAEDLLGAAEVVGHECPDLLNVLENHLWGRLEDAAAEVVENARHLLSSDAFLREVGTLRFPAEAVRLSGDLAIQLLAGTTARDVLTRLPGRRRERLRECFHEVDPRHLALPLVAAAAFQGQPVGKVVRAADRLRESMPGQEIPPDPFLRCLPDNLDVFVSGFKGLDEEAAQRGRDPRVILLPESLGRDVLTVAWRDLPGLRATILGWLEAQAEQDDPAIRIQAAQAVGMFAVLDFEHVAGSTLLPWLGSPNPLHHRAFSLALEAAAGADERTAERVRRLLRSGGSLLARGALIDAYGTRIGALFPGDALRAIDVFLRDTAMTADIVDGATLAYLSDGDQVAAEVGLSRIARVVTEIFAGGAAHQVLNQLREWSGGPLHGRESVVAFVRRKVAVRAMVRVARLPAPGTAVPRQPALLRMLAGGEVSAARLRPLWQVSLADRDMGKSAWQVLRRWVEAADGDENLVEPVRDLVVPLATRSGLERKRYYHQIEQWKRRRGGAAFQAFPNI